MPKKGDRYILTLGDEISKGLWKIEGFNALVFDEFGLDRLTKLDDAEEKCDMVLDDFCKKQELCNYCIMRSLFPKCGAGMHVCYLKGYENEAAHNLMAASDLMKGE